MIAGLLACVTGRLPAFVLRPFVLAMLLVLLPPTTHAASDAEKRIALVIGVGAYQNAPHLANPVNDARAIGDSLRRLNFDVTELYDPDFRSLNSGIRAFGIRAATADVAVVYYAGHGVQVERENYLIPADAKLERERDLLYEAMPLDRLLGEVSQASRMGIVLLDSCRNNPFIDRVARSLTLVGRAMSTMPGLARVDNVPRNTMVVMAAKADQIAEDGRDHSPFAAALLAHLQIPGLELSLFFRSVRDTVLRSTSNRQEPYVFSSLGAEPFYFYPRPPNRPPVIGPVMPLEVTDVAGPTPLGLADPTDPDLDPLTIRIIGLPRFGEVRVDGRPVSINTVFSVDRLKTATYKPDGKSTGSAGSLDILVEDGRGGSAAAGLPINVRSSHHLPIVSGPAHVQVSQQLLGIAPPVSPDGDTLTVIINALPRGTVRNGAAILHPGDHLTPQELSRLTFWPEAGFAGPAGSLRYTVDNGHGGTADGSLDVEVGTPSGIGDPGPEAALWENLRVSNDPAEFDAFLRRYPDSRFAAESKRRRAELLGAAGVGTTRIAARPDPATASATAASSSKPSDKPNTPTPPPQIASSLIASPQTASPQTASPQTAAPQTALTGEPAVATPSVMTAANGPLIGVPSTPPRGQSAETNHFQDCPDCPRMVRIPRGGFMMGLGARDAEALPAHRVAVREFAMGQYPVTVAEWKACMAAKGCSFLPRMRVADDRTPVHNLSWDDVGQYIAWLSKTTAHPYRLPSEAEWEYAARGGTTARYWWGDAVGMSLANCADCGGPQNPYGPLPVDALSANPYGLYDMLGGVAQWTADCWFPNYQGAPLDENPRDRKGCDKRVLRGGSFRSAHDEIAVSYRLNYDASVRYIVNGFRVARDLE